MAPATRSAAMAPDFAPLPPSDLAEEVKPKRKVVKKKVPAKPLTPTQQKKQVQALKNAAKDAETAAKALLGLSKKLKKQATK